jgi:hypothetical protein
MSVMELKRDIVGLHVEAWITGLSRRGSGLSAGVPSSFFPLLLQSSRRRGGLGGFRFGTEKAAHKILSNSVSWRHKVCTVVTN